MRIIFAIALLASASNARRVQATIDEQSNDLLERMQAVIADPSFKDQTRQIAKPIEAMMSEVERLQTAFSDPNLQKQAKRMIEPVTAMMADPKFQEEVKRVAEQVKAVMEDPTFLEEAKHIAEPLVAMIDNPDSQDPKHVMEQLQAVMADASFQEQAKRVTDPIKEMMSNEDLQEQARNVFQQMDEVIADPKFQKEAKRISEPMMAMMADAEQVREVLADPSFQQGAKRMAEQMQAVLVEEPVNPSKKSLASLLLAANPSLAGIARSGAATPRSSQRGRIVMGDDIAGKVNAIITEQLGVDADKVTPDASFTEDLGADSLDAVELIMAIEEAFDIEIPDEEAEKMTTPGDCVTAIEAKLS